LHEWKDGTTAAYRSGVLSKWSSMIKENAEDIGKMKQLIELLYQNPYLMK
jgi:hypothetical protein